MNLSAMTKEQKQYMFLGALVGGIVLYSFFTFVLGPMKANWASAREEVDEFRAKVEEGQRLIESQAKLSALLEESDAVMNAAIGTYIPDPSNPLAWATRTLYELGREVGLDIRAVSELAASAVLVSQGNKGDRQFGAYSVRMESECDFAMLKRFLHSLDASNPYVCVSGISVESRAGEPVQHGVSLTIEPAETG